VAIVEPDNAEKIVPPLTATTDRRPGTARIRRSMASMARKAMPLRSRMSPITRNSGTGARLKLAIDAIEPRMNDMMPFSPPRKTTAPTMLVRKNAKATGKADQHRQADEAQHEGQGGGPCHHKDARSVTSYESRTTP
jgi:hypothetical protein